MHVRAGVADEFYDRAKRAVDLRSASFDRGLREMPPQMGEHLRVAIAELDCGNAALAQRNEHAPER